MLIDGHTRLVAARVTICLDLNNSKPFKTDAQRRLARSVCHRVNDLALVVTLPSVQQATQPYSIFKGNCRGLAHAFHAER